LRQDTTGVVICVLNSHNENITQFASIRFLQKVLNKANPDGFYNPKLERSCVAVLAKADTTDDSRWQKKGLTGPYHRLQRWLCSYDTDGHEQGAVVGEDEPDAVLRSIFKGGFVALKNREQAQDGTELTLTFEQALEEEHDFFTQSQMTPFLRDAEPAPGSLDAPRKELNELGNMKLGLSALLRKMDRMIQVFLSDEFIPNEIKRYVESIEKAFEELRALGIKPITWDYDKSGFSSEAESLRQHIKFIILKLLAGDKTCELVPRMKTVCSLLFDSYIAKGRADVEVSPREVFQHLNAKFLEWLPSHAEKLEFVFDGFNLSSELSKINAEKSFLANCQLKLDVESKMMKVIQEDMLALKVNDEVLKALQSKFQEDVAGTIQLHRFSDTFGKVCERHLSACILNERERLQKSLLRRFSNVWDWSAGGLVEDVHGTQAKLSAVIPALMKETAVQVLLCPIAKPSCLAAAEQEVAETLSSNFVENTPHAVKRRQLEIQLDTFVTIIYDLTSMLTESATPPRVPRATAARLTTLLSRPHLSSSSSTVTLTRASQTMIPPPHKLLMSITSCAASTPHVAYAPARRMLYMCANLTPGQHTPSSWLTDPRTVLRCDCDDCDSVTVTV
jgi:hypothetical protein